jgi:hypothetical protein
MEIEAEARRARKAADSSFLELLRSANPPVTFACAFEETEARLGGDRRWGSVAEGVRRRELFDAYVAAAAQVRLACLLWLACALRAVRRGVFVLWSVCVTVHSSNVNLTKQRRPTALHPTAARGPAPVKGRGGAGRPAAAAQPRARDRLGGGKGHGGRAFGMGLCGQGQGLLSAAVYQPTTAQLPTKQPTERNRPPNRPTNQIGPLVEAVPACAALTPQEREDLFLEYTRKVGEG